MNEREFNKLFPCVRTEEVSHIVGVWFQYVKAEELPVHNSPALGIEFYLLDEGLSHAYYEDEVGIFVTKAAVEILTSNELDAILAHEHQHRMLDHTGLLQDFITLEGKMPAETYAWLLSRMRHSQELQADRGAGSRGLAKELVSGIDKIVGIVGLEDEDGECDTHPSNTTRARALGITK